MIGQTISHYKILEKLGEGGMGVVYKAQDTKLNRSVALKFLPPHMSASDQDKARFMQEAQAAAALNHPNICTIYGIEDHENQMFIAMEYVEGQTMRDVSARRGDVSSPAQMGEGTSPLPMKQSIEIGIQLADGLAAAHEKGIVHRDIKPENIMLQKDGRVRIMDFGLAKLKSASRLTKAGSTVGTTGYMSPEQVQGLESDHRSDIFSLGVILYELFSGQSPFKGVHETAINYEIVNVDPDPISSVKPDVAPELDSLVLECLEKDPNERAQSAKQIAIDLKRFKRESSRQRMSRMSTARPIIRSSGVQSMEETEPLAQRIFAIRKSYLGFAALFCFLGMVTFAVLYFTRTSAESASVSSYILPPEKLTFASGSGPAGEGQIALSPDGTMLAFVAADSSGKTHLMVRAMNALIAKELPTTEGAYYPFWSQDNRHIAFFQLGKLKKVEAAGGPSVTICDASDGRSGSWNQDGVILFSPNADSPVYKVSASGGSSIAVTKLDTVHHERSHRWSSFLPDGKHFLYFARASFGGVEREDDALMVASLDGKVNKRLMPAKGNASYASGYLMYLRERTLMAQAFDLGKLEVAGDAIPIAEPVEYDLNYNRAIFSVSQNGLLLYQASTTQGGYQLEWYDRSGKNLGKLGEPADYGSAVSLSPDGKQLAFDAYDRQSRNRDIWLYDIARKLKTRFTFDPSVDEYPVWAPDGSRILFHSDRKGHYDLYQKTTSGAGVEELLMESSMSKSPSDWSSNGKYIAYIVNDPKSAGDLWILPLEIKAGSSVGKPSPFLQTEFDESAAQLSPDMRWIAYQSNESGNYEVYVRPFLGSDGQPVFNQSRKWQISTSGTSPLSWARWSRTGKEIYYFASNNKLMVAEVKTNGMTFDVGEVKPLFEVNLKGIVFFEDVTSDGKKFLMALQVGGQTVPPLTLVTNWEKELKKK